MFMDDVTRGVLGVDRFLKGFALQSPLALATYTRQPFEHHTPWQHERQKLTATQVWFEQLGDPQKLLQTLQQVPDLRAIWRHLESQTPLKEGDLYTLKRALFYGWTLAQQASALLGQWTNIDDDIAQLFALMTLIHPERQPSARFLVSDDLDPRLGEARRQQREARRAENQHRQTIEAQVSARYPNARVDIRGLWHIPDGVDGDPQLEPHGNTWRLVDAHLTHLQTTHQQMQEALETIIGEVFCALSDRLRPRLIWMRQWFEIVVSLDVRLAKVRLLQQIDGCWPQWALEDGFDVCQGCAPHMHKSAQRVDLQTALGQPVVLTGPNMGGKSSLLTLVGMAHWCVRYLFPFSAQAISLSPVDHVVYVGADANRQSDEEGLSSFGREVHRLVEHQSHPGRICWLFDELGRGTHPEEGDRLAQEIIGYFASKGHIVWCATHFTGVAQHGDAEHFQMAGLDHEQLTQNLPSSDAQMLQVLQSAMNYQPIRQNEAGHVPRDARAIARALGLGWLDVLD